jgi:glycosyltransferase involved in cell wall biosynthesis
LRWKKDHHDHLYGKALKMRVLHVVPSYIPAWRYGGTIHAVHGQCRGLVRSGLDVHVYTTSVDGDGDSDVPIERPVDLDGVKVTYFPSDRLRRLYYSPRMAAALRGRVGEFDLLHLHSVFLWPTWAAARQARKAGVPYIIAPEGMLVRELIRRKSRWAKKLWIRLIERRSLRLADGIQTTSPRELEEFKSFGFESVEPFLIPHGIDVDELGPPPSRPPAPPEGRRARILFLGRISWEKGLDRLIPAMRHISDVELVIAGNDESGYTNSLKELARRHGLLDQVTFKGVVLGEEKWQLFRSAALLVLPSYSENFGMVAMEAMAVGRPVVVTPEVGLAAMVAEADSGIVVAGEPDQLGPAIDALLRDDEQLRNKAANGRRTIEERFTWERVAGQLRHKYEEIVQRA